VRGRGGRRGKRRRENTHFEFGIDLCMVTNRYKNCCCHSNMMHVVVVADSHFPIQPYLKSLEMLKTMSLLLRWSLSAEAK